MNEENIDMSGLAKHVDNIENISLDATESQSISISLEDVIDVTDDSNTLRIDGDEGDTVTLEKGDDDATTWTLGDFKTDAETGSSYQEVTGTEEDTTVTVEVNTDIQIDQS